MIMAMEQRKKLLVAMKMRHDTLNAVAYWAHMTRKIKRECAYVMSDIKRNSDTTIDNKIELFSTLSDQMGVAAMKEIEARRLLSMLNNLIKNTKAGL